MDKYQSLIEAGKKIVAEVNMYKDLIQKFTDQDNVLNEENVKLLEENTELQKKVESLLDDVIIAERKASGAQQESLDFNVRFIAEQDKNDLLEAQCGEMRVALINAEHKLTGLSNLLQGEVLNMIAKALSKNAGADFIEEYNRRGDEIEKLKQTIKTLTSRYCVGEG